MTASNVAAHAKRKRKVGALVAGNWVSDGESGVVFRALPTQPAEPITDIQDMVKWEKSHYGDIPRSVEFVRRVPGRLQIAVQQVITSIMKESE